MNLSKLISYTKKSTLLGAGPMSKNCVIAATDISNKYNFDYGDEVIVPSQSHTATSHPRTIRLYR